LSIYSIFIFAYRFGCTIKLGSGEDKQVFRAEGDEDDSESWESKLVFLVATIASVFGFGNVWLFT